MELIGSREASSGQKTVPERVLIDQGDFTPSTFQRAEDIVKYDAHYSLRERIVHVKVGIRIQVREISCITAKN